MPNLLKSLELNGFKSFAQKTSLEFPEGITAIVGPNGSGKSNLIDAIRWLLGERDAKNLRGGKGEDLIFAGTPKRPRLGLAQASLHFDNRNKFFPIDVAEIAVTRQVNRDGTNQYFLNKSEVRLKDLQDFFAQARLGSRGLTVITQGNSDMFIRATPYERREMIEEILGLREYQLKRTDAERRLRNAGINLEKAKALIEEIVPHLRSLKRQTNRWEKRSELDEELNGLENELFGGQFHELSAKAEIIKKNLDAHKRLFESLAKEKKTRDEELKALEGNQPKEREELVAVKHQLRALLEERSTLQKELGRFEAQIEAMERQGNTLSVPMEQLVKAIKDIKADLAGYETMDFMELQGVVKAILEDIDIVFLGSSMKSEGKAKSHGDLHVQLDEIMKTLQHIEKESGELKTREEALEKNQEGFYGAFKKAMEGARAAQMALDQWERAEREILLEKERVSLHEEELERQLTQAGRKKEDFIHLKIEKNEHGAHELERRIFRLRGELASMGEVDQEIIKEAKTAEERHAFLTRESEDLERAQKDLRSLIKELNQKIKTDFTKAMVNINREFGTFFELMFGGGSAKLKMQSPKVKTQSEKNNEDNNDNERKEEIEEEEPEEGIEVEVSLPRKRVNSLEMLSGGERSLVGIAALFALISVSPPPFLVLDEVDAPLDERNARRFGEMLKEFSRHTQFVVVTHNRATMEAANILYGVTLNEDGTSKILSIKLES